MGKWSAVMTQNGKKSRGKKMVDFKQLKTIAVIGIN